MQLIHTNNRRLPDALLAALSATFVLLMMAGAQLDFLQKCAEVTTSSGSVSFPEIITFCKNLRAGLVGIAIPASGVGITAGGLLYMTGNMGNRFAKVLLGGSLGGVLLVLFAPNLLA